MSMLNCTELSKSNADDANIYSKTKFKNSLKMWTFPGWIFPDFKPNRSCIPR